MRATAARSPGSTGSALAPFQILAAEGRLLAVERPHSWHLETLARLDAGDGLITPTRHVSVTLADEASRRRAAEWWEELTAAGCEGMVVKPLKAPTGRVQPAVKVRGREYLRIIYGPDYTEPEQMRELRRRALGKKRSMALREYALGLEALTRLVEGEPLWRIARARVRGAGARVRAGRPAPVRPPRPRSGPPAAQRADVVPPGGDRGAACPRPSVRRVA